MKTWTFILDLRYVWHHIRALLLCEHQLAVDDVLLCLAEELGNDCLLVGVPFARVLIDLTFPGQARGIDLVSISLLGQVKKVLLKWMVVKASKLCKIVDPDASTLAQSFIFLDSPSRIG